MNDWSGLLICVKLVIFSFIIHHIEIQNQILFWFRGKVPIYYACYAFEDVHMSKYLACGQ